MARGSRKGERRGGRQKGTPNKLSQDIAAKLKRLGCDPITRMAKLAQTTPDEAIQARLYTELAKYVYPQRKAVDPEGLLTREEATGFVLAATTMLRQAILRHIDDPDTAARIVEDLAHGFTSLGLPPGQSRTAAADPPAADGPTAAA